MGTFAHATGQWSHASRRSTTLKVTILHIVSLSLAGVASAQSTGDYRTVGSGSWSDPAVWERFDVAAWLPATTFPTSADSVITVRAPHDIVVVSDLAVDQTIVESGAQVSLNDSIVLTVEDGPAVDFSVVGTFQSQGTTSLSSGASFTTVDGTVDLGDSSLVIGSGDFTLGSGATLRIGSSAGIDSSGPSGNVRNTGARDFSTEAHYVYAGTSAQSTGSGLPGTVNSLTIDNASGVSLTANVAVSGFPDPEAGTLGLTSGVFDLGSNTLRLDGAVSVGSGSLSSAANGTTIYNQGSNGQVVIAADYGNLTFNDFTKVLPSSGVVGISGTFTPGNGTGHTISGSTIEFNGSSAQSLPSGFPIYHNLVLDNASGTSGFDGLTVDALVRVRTGTVVLQGTNDFVDVQIDGAGAVLQGASGVTMRVSGGWSNDGTFDAMGSAVVLDGTSPQTIGGAESTTFGELAIDNGAGVALGLDTFFSGVLTRIIHET